MAKEISSTAEICVIHGDFSLQKILYDAYSQTFRLINPRGSFGRKGIYGDARYDIAKLRQSVCGLLDFIRSGIFELDINHDNFSGRVIEYSTPGLIMGQFDKMISEKAYKLNEIKFIEGLHFLTATPIYENEKEKQLMLYLSGLKLLNEAMNANSN